jgi:hypothetical protein
MMFLGNGHLVPESSFTHYEKACVSSKHKFYGANQFLILDQLVDLCRGYPIIR